MGKINLTRGNEYVHVDHRQGEERAIPSVYYPLKGFLKLAGVYSGGKHMGVRHKTCKIISTDLHGQVPRGWGSSKGEPFLAPAAQLQPSGIFNFVVTLVGVDTAFPRVVATSI